jgi:hypothetical protein
MYRYNVLLWLRVIGVSAFLLFLTACQFSEPGNAELAFAGGQAEDAPPTATSTPTKAPEVVEDRPAVVDPTATPTITPTPLPQIINPLTGLPLEDPSVLCQRPLLVSVSNFPVSSRPQSGLSTAAMVWETFIGEGMTRLLAVFYGDYASHLREILNNRLVEGSLDGFVIGPVRSGRVVYEDIKTLFVGSRLVTAGASGEVAKQLTNRSNVFGSDPDDINSAGMDLDDLGGWEDCPIDPMAYETLVFGTQPPSGGETAPFVRIVYNHLNQIGWTYDPERGVYLRSQDLADGTGDLVPTTDRLTGEQLGFENVVVMWAQHRFVTPTIIEMALVYVENRKGLLFRDGNVYEILWSTRKGQLTIHDRAGELVPLKPGATFFEVVSWESTWRPQERIVRYHNPPMK